MCKDRKVIVTLVKQISYPKAMIGKDIDANVIEGMVIEDINNELRESRGIINNNFFDITSVEFPEFKYRNNEFNLRGGHIRDIALLFAKIEIERQFGVLDVEKNPDIFVLEDNQNREDEYEVRDEEDDDNNFEPIQREPSYYLKEEVEQALHNLRQNYEIKISELIQPNIIRNNENGIPRNRWDELLAEAQARVNARKPIYQPFNASVPPEEVRREPIERKPSKR